MKTAKVFRFELSAFNFRRELRLALLAAMESCWVYSALLFVAQLMHVPALSSPLTLFSAYWIALIVGRELPRRRARWVILQALTVLIAVTVLLVMARIEIYSQHDWLDFGWMPRYLRALFLAEDFGHAIYFTLGLVYVFIRGLGFGSRPLTLWFVGFQFRLGVVVFFVLTLASAVYSPVDTTPWIFVYFFISLLSISLARLDEMGSDLHYGPRWAITLLSGVALVVFLGLAFLQMFTLDMATWFLRLFSPLWLIVEIALLVILIPASIVASFLVEWLRPLFAGIGQLLQGLARAIPQSDLREAQNSFQSDLFTQYLLPALKTAATLAIILWVGYLLVRALNRRMQQVEEETYERETLESEDEGARARRAFLPQKRLAARRAGHIAAETIRRIYAAMIARAQEAGLPRKAAETPYEFSPRLQSAWQEQSDDVRAITEAYVAVHYAEHDATNEEVAQARAAWERIKGK